METNYVKEVAATILNQLGGKRFAMFTGAHSFACRLNQNGNPELQFKLQECDYLKDNINMVRIELGVMDLYNMYFFSGELIQVKNYDGVYWDNLEELFTEATGLLTHF